MGAVARFHASLQAQFRLPSDLEERFDYRQGCRRVTHHAITTGSSSCFVASRQYLQHASDKETDGAGTMPRPSATLPRSSTSRGANPLRANSPLLGRRGR
eukprot:11334741-Alexandrium_andersonii.AAC.1